MLAGTAQLQVRFKTKDVVLPLLVTDGTGCSPLGLDCLLALQIRLEGIHHVIQQRSTCALPEVQSVLDCHPRVFDEDISGYTGPHHVSARYDLFMYHCGKLS